MKNNVVSTNPSYTLIKRGKTIHLAKILGVYKGDGREEEAYEDMYNLLNKNITEDEIEKEKWRKRK